MFALKSQRRPQLWCWIFFLQRTTSHKKLEHASQGPQSQWHPGFTTQHMKIYGSTQCQWKELWFFPTRSTQVNETARTIYVSSSCGSRSEFCVPFLLGRFINRITRFPWHQVAKLWCRGKIGTVNVGTEECLSSKERNNNCKDCARTGCMKATSCRSGVWKSNFSVKCEKLVPNMWPRTMTSKSFGRRTSVCVWSVKGFAVSLLRRRSKLDERDVVILVTKTLPPFHRTMRKGVYTKWQQNRVRMIKAKKVEGWPGNKSDTTHEKGRNSKEVKRWNFLLVSRNIILDGKRKY